MANKTRFQIAKKDIVLFFGQRPQKVYREREIEAILSQNRSGWRLAGSTRVRDFLALMTESTPLKAVEVEVDNQLRVLYTWGEATVFELGSNLLPRAYLSHYTAVLLHDLTEQLPKQIFVNQEQSLKQLTQQLPLTQDELDKAFAKSPKLSRPQSFYKEYSFVRLNSKFSNELGIINQEHFTAGNVRLTSLERTLIDIAVRPDYAGGVYQVLEAFRGAADRVSVNKLVGMLTKLKYRYPYHQALGFYMSKAGNYKLAQLNLLRKLEMNFDFYLTHAIKNTNYNEEWRLYYPAGF